MSTCLDERCSCFLVTLFRLQQHLAEVGSTAQRIQPRVSREGDRLEIATIDSLREELHGPIRSTEVGQTSRKMVKAFWVA